MVGFLARHGLTMELILNDLEITEFISPGV